MSTETKNLPVFPEPAGWLTRFVNRSGLNCQVLCNHNSVGDYRDIDPGATSERVYSESQMHAYALEAIRASATSAPEQTEADRKIITLTNQLLELQLLIQRRPAMNIGLFEAYEKWNGECYLLDWMNAVDNATPQPAEGS